MPAPSSPALTARVHPALDQRRRSERRACKLPVTLRAAGGELTASLLDLSAGGIGFRVNTFVALRPGSSLTLIHPQLGHVPCVLRWAMHPRYGAEFVTGHHGLAGVRAVYDSLPPAPGEVI